MAVGLLVKYTNVINQLIYFPESIIYQDPGDLGLEFEDVYLTTSDGVRIHGWFVPGSGGRRSSGSTATAATSATASTTSPG